ncbi:hypothetical protein M433DRAFT_161269, partial [Acidomyces richmondensis BFW]
MASSDLPDSSQEGENLASMISTEKNSEIVDSGHAKAIILLDIQDQMPHDIEKGLSATISQP